ncbi:MULTISPECIES: DUF4156 domain-containing protein [Rhodanobacteraceae]|uniref:DUF4156 domain-containing protein n=1 Tax=Rhodanobacteraceae TaxID=1775411 RepID=UPI00055BEDFD|nr:MULTISPECIES: DUF4156 domain-containing protein [Rhodanobacteraceae]MDR6642159.1 hypothetical protein [Luteibacter sp. 1214]SDG12882.1 protein of unknown function [Dyella sp. 333MFSha]
MRKALVLLIPLALSACTWGIKLDDSARNVRTAWNGDVSSCRDQGKVTVSVQSRVGPIDRNDLKVRDELEVLARNEAAKMGADTVKPLGDPNGGSQEWGAYSCGPRGAGPGRANNPPPPPPQNNNTAPQAGFETVPLKN